MDWHLTLGGGIHSPIDPRRIILLCCSPQTDHGDGHRASSLAEGVAVVVLRVQQINFEAVYPWWVLVE